MDEVDVYKIAIEVLRDTINYQNEDVDNSYVSGIIDMTDRMIEHITENEIINRKFGFDKQEDLSLKFENIEVWGFEHSFRGMRNPKNSWDRSDSGKLYWDGTWYHEELKNYFTEYGVNFYIGENDMKLAQSLIKAGSEHCKFMRMIHVAVDTNMPRYWWSEADTYHFNTKNSCSTMHKLLNNDEPITLDMFVICDEDIDWWNYTVNKLESMRLDYKKIQRTTKDANEMNRLLIRAKRMLPEGFEQMRTWDTNYAELRNMYFQRRYHRLKEEWVDTFCKWVEGLPYAKELIMYDGK